MYSTYANVSLSTRLTHSTHSLDRCHVMASTRAREKRSVKIQNASFFAQVPMIAKILLINPTTQPNQSKPKPKNTTQINPKQFIFINTMGNSKSNTAIITEDWVDVDIDDTASEYDSEEEEDMECDGKLLRSLLCVIGTFVYTCINNYSIHAHVN